MDSFPNPIAIVMGQMMNPVAYMPMNDSNVIKGDSDSDFTVSPPISVAAILSPIPVPQGDSGAPFRVPHLYWNCVTDGPASCFPVSIHTLFDHGSHTVLISEQLVDSLALCHRKLLIPEVVGLAMQTGKEKVKIVLYDWVKLKLHDPSLFWSTKSVQAIVAPGLCAPVILGFPFLAHNNIVIDHAMHTAIDKVTGFDLLHPLPPPALKLPM